MKINRAGLSFALLAAPLLAAAGCSVIPPQPAPAQREAMAPPVPRPAPPRPDLPRPATPQPISLSAEAAVPSPRADGRSWRDLPATPGRWTYAAQASGSAARFGSDGAPPLVVLRCDRRRGAMILFRAGLGAGQVPVTVTTSATIRRLAAAPVSGPGAVQNAAMPFEIVLATADPLLDAMAFSRGRFMLEMSGAQTLILPAWSELGRVIEDCR